MKELLDKIRQKIRMDEVIIESGAIMAVSPYVKNKSYHKAIFVRTHCTFCGWV